MKNKILISGVLIALSGCSSPMISYDAYEEQPVVFFLKKANKNLKKKNELGVIFQVKLLIAIQATVPEKQRIL